MKKLLLLLLTTILLTSCQMKEEITFNKNGSGTYSFGADMSGMIDMLKGMEKTNNPIVSKEKKKKKIDTIIDINQMIKEYKDSIKLSKEQKKIIKKMKGLKMRMIMNEEDNKMSIDYTFDFKNAKQLDDFFSNLKTINKMKKKKNDSIGLGKLNDFTKDFDKQFVKYRFNGKKFHREVVITKNKEKKEQDSTKNNEFNQFSKLFSYKLVYHFPSKIKDVGYKGEYKFADNGKTLIIEIPFDEMIKKPKKMDFEILLR